MSERTRILLLSAAILVIVSVMLITVFIGAVDFVFNKLLQWFAQSI